VGQVVRRGQDARGACNVPRHPALVEQRQVERQLRDGRLGRRAAAREADHEEATAPA
jgi:hypothetical protein